MDLLMNRSLFTPHPLRLAEPRSGLVKLLSCLFSLVFLVLPLCANAQAAPSAQTRRPNILWLVAEDFGQHLGCYGTKEVWSPNLDRLATQGVRYTRFYTTAPVCSPSRSAFMTGMYHTSIGAHN